MRTTMLAAAAALSLGIGVAVADGAHTPAANAQYASLPGVIANTYHREDGDLAQLTTRQTGNVELAYVTTTRGESTQQWNQNEGVGG
jgi:hypothetical protein